MISAIVITKNEEERIKVCLESLKWTDEIIVVDSKSSDSTLDIAKKYTEKIYNMDTEDFAKKRNLGAEKAVGDWLLYIDADERVLVPLKEEIETLIKTDEFAAFAISRRNIVFGEEQKYGPFWPDWVIRLIRKENLKGWVGKIHEYAKIDGKLGYTKNSLLHLTHRGIDHIVTKSLEWSKIDAPLRLEANHPKMEGWRFLRIFFGELFYQGIKRKGFFSGTIGIMDSILQTFSLFITYVRLWQLQQNESLDEIYEDIDAKLLESNFNLDK